MALLPPFFLDTVVAIGTGSDPDGRSWIGTGFLFGRFSHEDKTTKEKHFKVWLITNKHVLKGAREIYIKFNSATEPNSKDYKIQLIARNGKLSWIGHPDDDTDVAAIFVNANILRQDNRHFYFVQEDDHVAKKEKLRAQKITEGDRVFVLGFPMAMVSPERQYVICRGGVIARIRDFLEDKARDFLVDATVFPGNSGGPVILCPSALAIAGTNSISNADLVGIVKSYVPYRDVAVSQQTRNPRVVFEENSGLTAVESVDAILETVMLAEKRLKGRVAQARFKQRKKTSAEQVPVPSKEPSK